MMRLLYGKGIVEVYAKMVRDGSQILGLDTSAALLILAILLLVRLAVGAIGGWGAWKLGGAVAHRLGQRNPAPPSSPPLGGGQGGVSPCPPGSGRSS